MKISQQILAAAVAGAFLGLAATDSRAQAATPAAAAKAPAAKQRTFASAEEAAAALAAAVRTQKAEEVLAVVGPSSASWLSSGDPVADRNDWNKFLAAYDKKNALEKSGDAKAILAVGDDAWPFPAPIVKKGATWTFDADAGREEIINRRVGRNELDAIQTLLAAVDAQREYAASDPDKNGYADYAKRFKSSPGKKDGLYWPAAAGEAPSPLGELFAAAAKEGYGEKGKPQAFHGYVYSLLTSQGKGAPGGAYNYMVGDKLLGGFGIVAYPAAYGSSGVMTFMVNHEGVVYEKDLGKDTATAAAQMKRFDLDATWKKPQ
jgi:hypothetical protein